MSVYAHMALSLCATDLVVLNLPILPSDCIAHRRFASPDLVLVIIVIILAQPVLLKSLRQINQTDTEGKTLLFM